jgi:hypothetical protein
MSYSTNFPPKNPVATIFPRGLLAGRIPGARLAVAADESKPLDITVHIKEKKSSNKDVETAYYLFTTFNIVVALYHIVHFILKGSI